MGQAAALLGATSMPQMAWDKQGPPVLFRPTRNLREGVAFLMTY